MKNGVVVLSIGIILFLTKKIEEVLLFSPKRLPHKNKAKQTTISK